MIDTETTPHEEVDVLNESTEEQVEIVNNDVIETVPESIDETTTDDDYDKAWENTDVDAPPENLFGETNDPLEESVPEKSIEEPVVDNVVTEDDLVITNPILKYKGREIPIESEAEMIALAQKGFKLENEMSKIKPQKQMLGLIDEGGFSSEDIKAFADAKNGNAEAFDYVKRMFGFKDTSNTDDIFGIESEQEAPKGDYSPQVKATDEVAEYFKGYTEESPTNAALVSETYENLEDQFKQEVYNSNVFPAFAKSVENGEFEKVYPYVLKYKNSNPALTWLQAYGMAGEKVLTNTTETKKTVTPPKSTSIPKNTSTERTINKGDYDASFDMSLEELENRIFA